MVSHTRSLKLAVLILLAGCRWYSNALALELGEVQPVPIGPIDPLRFDNPEGIALDPYDGSLYVGNRFVVDNQQFSQILKRDPDGHVSVIADLPPASVDVPALLGLATDAGGDVYAAFASFDANSGIYRFRRGGRVPPERLSGSEDMVFPNAMTFDDSGNLFGTDSTGAIWRFRPEEQKAIGSVWTFGDLLTPLPGPVTIPGVNLELDLPGANGIAFIRNEIFAANTEKGLLVRVPIEADGTAGTAEVVAGDISDPFTAIFSIDGIAADAKGNVHAVVPGFGALLAGGVATSPVVTIDTATGGIAPIVTDPSAAFGSFDIPLSLAFGTLPREKDTVYVTNGALFPGLFPGAPGPGVVQVGVGVRGQRIAAAVPEPSTTLLVSLAVSTLALRIPARRRNLHVITKR